MITLGIDTSNYTTSCALYNSETDEVIQRKKLLPVKHGEKGIRQSDAVFHHTAQLYPLIEELMSEADVKPDAFGVSDRPRDAQGSYMPCFTVGIGAAHCMASVLGVPVYGFSHQSGHIMAALYSAGKTDLKDKEFIAFHLSGGTTEALYVKPDRERMFNCEITGKTLDLNCGQVIDRAGVMLGLDFPCGKALESLALASDKSFSPKVSMKQGDCCLSGAENLCAKMLSDGEKAEDIAAFCIAYIGTAVEKMAEYAVNRFGNLPLVFAGGVSSDSIIRDKIKSRFSAIFAQPEYSCDNAAGTAILAFERGKNNGG